MFCSLIKSTRKAFDCSGLIFRKPHLNIPLQTYPVFTIYCHEITVPVVIRSFFLLFDQNLDIVIYFGGYEGQTQLLLDM